MARYGSRWIVWAGTASLCAGLAACGHKPPASPAPPPAPPPAVAARPAPVPPPPPAPPPARRVQPPAAAPTEDEIFARESLAELNGKTPLGDAFFAYDQSDLSDQDRAALERDAEWMRKWTGTRVLIEGYADERGTSEYNLALGERRAAAARDYLVGLGINPSRILVMSKGKETPFCTDHTEDCWHQNRRGHFIVTAK